MWKVVHQLCVQSCRTVHTSCVLRQAPGKKSLLSEVRKETGYSIKKIKEALDKFGQDKEKTIAWLTEQAQKEGWDKATKLQSRPMSQGLVGFKREDNTGVMVEVNCETDFVARNEKFQELVRSVTNACLLHAQTRSEDKIKLNKVELEALNADTGTVGDLVALNVGNIGENMQVRRAVAYRAPEGTILGRYVHSLGQVLESVDDCQLGSFCTMSLMKPLPERLQTDPEYLEFSDEEIATNLCAQIMGCGATSIGTYEEEAEQETLQEATIPESTDEGNEDDGEEDDTETYKVETALLKQQFIYDEDRTVGQVLKENMIEIIDFDTIKRGEVDEAEVSNES